MFNAENYYKDNNMKLGIRNTIQVATDKKINYFAVGTRGATTYNPKDLENYIINQ